MKFYGDWNTGWQNVSYWNWNQSRMRCYRFSKRCRNWIECENLPWRTCTLDLRSHKTGTMSLILTSWTPGLAIVHLQFWEIIAKEIIPRETVIPIVWWWRSMHARKEPSTLAVILFCEEASGVAIKFFGRMPICHNRRTGDPSYCTSYTPHEE